MEKSLNVKAVLAAPLTPVGANCAVTFHTVGRVVPRTVRSPSRSNVLLPDFGRGIETPRIDVGTKVTVGNSVVWRTRPRTNPSRRSLSLLSVLTSMVNFDSEGITFPFASAEMTPVTPLVSPIASLGRSRPTSCSRILYRAAFPVGPVTYRSDAADCAGIVVSAATGAAAEEVLAERASAVSPDWQAKNVAAERT